MWSKNTNYNEDKYGVILIERCTVVYRGIQKGSIITIATHFTLAAPPSDNQLCTIFQAAGRGHYFITASYNNTVSYNRVENEIAPL